ncbi:exported hypothetical protein [groundwater metagenome]|uniref:Fe/B12 periplasmic-binding domain-containing protein n=1 Tax=groundwater metagenome TaxID=717931 RepID=A0A098EA07_9ZZZZ
MRKILPLLFGIFFVCFSFQIVFGENITCKEGTYLKNNSCVNYERVISLAPSITEIIYAINGQDNLIGVTMFCNYPEDAKSKTKVGGFVTPSIEKIISLNPDLVFAHDLTDPDDIKLLQNANITAVIINTSSNIEDIYSNIRTIAKYLGKDSEGENLINNMKEKIEKIKKIKSELIFSSPKISHIVWVDPLWVSGSNTFIDDIITTVGGVNVYSDIYRWQPVSVETLIIRDPDIIIAPSRDMSEYSQILNNPHLKNLKAVKNNDIYNINEDIISRASPRVIDALESVMGMIISYQYKHIPKYCMDNSDCTSGKCDSSIHICFKLKDESCAFDKECICENCENGVCKEKISASSSGRSESYKGDGNYGGSGTSSVKYVYTDSENKPVNVEESVFSSEIFNIPEIFGLKQTLNLGENFKDAEITIKVKNESRKFKSDENGNVTLTIPDYGSAEITISKFGFKNFTKTIAVYAGTLNITKISGEKYGNEFKFKVTTKEGIPVKNAEVEIYGEKLKTDANGIVTKQIKTIHSDLEASASANNYKSSNISFEVQAIGKLTIDAPEKVKQRDTLIITLIDENKQPVPNANVTINGVEHIADINGKVEYNVTITFLTLKAEKEGYISSEQISVAVEKDTVIENKTHNETKKDTLSYDNLLSFQNLTVIAIILITTLIIFLKLRKK